MKVDREGILKMWDKRISSHIEGYKNYDLTPQLKKMISLFVPGEYYFWILNFQNLEMDYVHPSLKNILKTNPDTFTIQEFFSLLPPEEMHKTQVKEDFVTDFLFNFLKPEEIMNYKIIYDLKINDTAGNIKHILHQATTLSLSDSKKVQHVMSIHTEVSHLNLNFNDRVSFIHLKGGTSYYNMDPIEKKFNPKNAISEISLNQILTPKEKEVINEVSKGKSSQEIGQLMNLSK
ncbi:MAG: hypothetical protein WEA99_05845, partial [Brumimicrobium sp.]